MDQKIFNQLLDEIRDIKRIMATKDDLKIALSNYPTKDDLKKEFAKYATKDDLKNFATKDDLKKLKNDLTEEIRDSEAFIVASADKNKAEKSVVEDLQRRVIKIERKLAS